jgi:isoquinoline 1-oxidoreductase alpha subunit
VAIELKVNGRSESVEAEPTTPLLWVLRENLGLTGTKYGCGAAQCGACTVHVDGASRRSCVLPVSAVAGRNITTIEGLAAQKHALLAAWSSVDVPQCGWCQPGQLMSAAGLLASKPAPTDEDIDLAMAGNVCRCATYVRIRAGIHAASKALGGGR